MYAHRLLGCSLKDLTNEELRDTIGYMVDIHAHILPGIDDGLQSWTELVMVSDIAGRHGIKRITATPHVSNGQLDSARIHRVLNEGRKRVDIELCYGAEVSILWAFDKTSDVLREYTLNRNGRTILVELPYAGPVLAAKEFLGRLRNEGFVPIISHIERYPYLSTADCHRMHDQGVFFQTNLGSFFGQYGAPVRRQAYCLLQERLISVLASDLHSSADYANLLPNITQLERTTSPAELGRLLDENPSRALEGDELA